MDKDALHAHHRKRDPVIEFFKMCRITCDRCDKASFEVYTFDDYTSAPSTWKLVSTHGYGAYKTQLCCPECIDDCKRFDNRAYVQDANYIRLEKDTSY